MYEWNFAVLTMERGRICYKVKANDKQTAIKKGFEKLEKKGLSYANHFDCTLVRH